MLSRAKKEPDGALRRHGILRLGILCHRHREEPPYFHLNKIGFKHLILQFNKERTKVLQSDLFEPIPRAPPKHRATLSTSTLMSAEALISAQDQEPFPLRSIWEMTGLKTCAALPGCLWFGLKWHAYGFQPPHGLFGEIYALCCGFIQDMCVCALRKVEWAHAGNMQAFVGIFLFIPDSPFDFFFRGSFVLNDFAFPDKYSTLPRLFFFFSSNNQMNVLLFLPWLPNDLHLWMSNDCTGGRGLLEKIIFKHMGIIIRKRNCYAWNEQRQL